MSKKPPLTELQILAIVTTLISTPEAVMRLTFYLKKAGAEALAKANVARSMPKFWNLG